MFTPASRATCPMERAALLMARRMQPVLRYGFKEFLGHGEVHQSGGRRGSFEAGRPSVGMRVRDRAPARLQTADREADNTARGPRTSRLCQVATQSDRNSRSARLLANGLASPDGMPHRNNPVIGLGLPWVT